MSILDFNPLLAVYFLNILPPLCRLPLHSNDGILCWKKLFSSMKSYLLIASLIADTIGVLFIKFFPVPLNSNIFSSFPFIKSKESDLMVIYFIHLVLSFVRDGR